MSADANGDRTLSETVYLELSDGQSHKFYEVTVYETEVTIRYGRIGTAGQSSSNTYATPEKAQAEATKKINEKLRKGYVQVSSGGAAPTVSEQLLADSTQPSDPRHYWVYGSGWFSADGQGGWEEVNEETRQRGQAWRFRETTRTEDYVELYDQSRRVTVRLKAMAMLVRWDQAGSSARWEKYHKGQWQEPPSSATAAPPLPAIDPTISAPDRSLLNDSPVFPPRVARNLLPDVRHRLGFEFREVGVCNLSIPLPRSLACIEIIGTFHDLAHSDFGIGLTANQDHEAVSIYRFNFQPNQRQMVQSSSVTTVWREERLEFPSTIASGQVFQYVLVITPERDIIFYLNNQPFFYPLDPSDPPDTLHLGYDPAGLKLQRVRVLELPAAERQVPRANPAVVTPVPPPERRSSPPQSITDMPSFLEDLPSQFEPLRSCLQQNLVPYIKIQAGEQVGSMDFFNRGAGDPLTVWQSKIGGNPYFPKTAEYPTDPDTGEAMPLLMQINCADVPPIAEFDFPQVGILQFYLGSQPGEASGTPGKYQVLYFPEILTDPSDLITDFNFIEGDGTIQQYYPEVYPITFSVNQALFWESKHRQDIESPEEFIELCDEFSDWMSDYDDEHNTQIRDSKLGGYVYHHNDPDEIAERVDGRLLMELIHPDMFSDSFLFFILDEQLRDRDFRNVEFHFVCD